MLATWGCTTFPKPTLSLDFLGATSLDSGITFTRATTATYFNSLGVLTTAASGAARFDYNPSTLQPRGLLIEEQRTNSLLQSQTFQTSWTPSTATVSADAGNAPDGTATADKVIPDNAATGRVQQTFTTTTGVTYTFSCFVKADGFGWVGLGMAAPGAYFDLSGAGAVGTTPAGYTASITSVGSGWYRCVVTLTESGGAARTWRINPASADNTLAVGDGTSGILVWGAQLEVGAFATSYIPTTTTALTRNADVATMTGTNFSSWYNQTEGTFFAQASSASASGNVVGSSDNTNNNRIVVGTASGPVSRLLMTTLGSLQASVTVAYTLNTVAKFAGAYKLNSSNFALNGTLGIEDTVCTIPTVDRLSIGTNTTATEFFVNGWISRIAYYPTRLPNATLQALTA